MRQRGLFARDRDEVKGNVLCASLQHIELQPCRQLPFADARSDVVEHLQIRLLGDCLCSGDFVKLRLVFDDAQAADMAVELAVGYKFNPFFGKCLLEKVKTADRQAVGFGKNAADILLQQQLCQAFAQLLEANHRAADGLLPRRFVIAEIDKQIHAGLRDEQTALAAKKARKVADVVFVSQ